MREELDDILDQSRPPVSETEHGLVLARTLATDLAVSPAKNKRRRTLAVFGASLAGTLTLGAGAAFAAPLVAQWWQWIPAEDLTLTTEPFEHDGEVMTCDIAMKVLTDGQTADEDSTARLLDARVFLGTIELENYSEQAQTLLETDLKGFPPETTNYGFAVHEAIRNDFNERGLLGRGVSLESRLECTTR